MVYTKEEFIELWDNADPCPITCDDCADCAKAWGLLDNPRCYPIDRVIDMVVEDARRDVMDYDEICDAWRVLSDDDKHTVLADGFSARSMASAWARKNVKAKSWLIEGYKHSCVIKFDERDFNAADNL